MDTNKIIVLCKKVKELADRGVGGEQLNAVRMLRNLMEKHNISFSDIESNTRKERWFTVKNKKLFVQVAASVIMSDSGGTAIEVYSRKNGKRRFALKVTDAEYIEIDAKYKYYQGEYDKELKRFVKAFIIRNRIYPTGTVNNSKKTFSDEEMRELFELLELAKGINKSDYYKQIG